jgi:tetratricopeptide (TPR) repeat protein
MEHAVIVQRRQDSSPAAYECVLRGIAHLRGYAPDDNDRAIALFRQALQIDPLHALAQAYLAFAEIVVNDFDASPRELLEDCKIRIDQALARDPADGRIHWLLANLHGYLGERDDERRQLERALEINPNDANAMISYGMSLAFSGRGEEGIATIREAMRLNPYHPEWYWLSLGAAFMLMRRFEDAIEAYKRRTRPKVWVLSRLAVCYAHLGRDHEAREMGRQILRQNPAFRISTLRKGGWPAAGIDLLRDGLRKAGLPE